MTFASKAHSGTTKKPINSALLLAVAAAFLFSTKPILIKYLYQLQLQTLDIMLVRMLLSLPVYIVIGLWAWKKYQHQNQQPPPLLLLVQSLAVGLLGYYLASFLDIAGLQYVSAQLERLVLYAYPSFVVILAALLGKRALKRSALIPLIITYGGLLLMYSQDLASGIAASSDIQRGSLLVLASALSFALYIVLSKPLISRLGALLFTSLSMIAATVATVIHTALAQAATPGQSVWLTLLSSIHHYTSSQWLGLIALTIFATIIPTFMVSSAIKTLGPEKTAMAGMAGPVMTTVLAVVFLAEPIALVSVLGMGLVMLGVYRLGR